MKNNEEYDGESSASITPLTPPEGRVLKTEEQKLNSATAHLTSDMEGLLLLNPP